MILAFALATALAQNPTGNPSPSPRAWRDDQGWRVWRSTGRTGAGYAFFEFAPASGAGMGTACACAAITSANGTAIAVARTGAATCAKQANATTGILNGDLVECTNNNEPRVESSAGNTSLRVEAAATNVLLRFIDIANATWADVGTPILGGGQISPFSGGLSASAISMDDDAAGTQEGRTQTVTVTAAVAYTMSCYVKALTTDQATISLDGTTASITGLSSSTWSLVSVTDASTSGVAVVAQILVGDAAADTGSVIWGGCQVELRSQATRMIPTTAAAVTRNAEVPSVTMPVAMPGSTFCMAATIDVNGSPTTGVAYSIIEGSQNVASGDVNLVYVFNSARRVDLVASAVRQNSLAGATPPFGSGSTRYVSRFDGSTLDLFQNGVSIDSDTGAAITIDPLGYIYIGADNIPGSQLNGNIWNVQVDPSPSRCSL